MKYFLMFVSLVLTPILWMCYVDTAWAEQRVLRERMAYWVTWRSRAKLRGPLVRDLTKNLGE